MLGRIERGFAGRFEPISDPRLGNDVLRRAFGFHFLTKLTDKDAEMLWLFYAVRSPNGVEKLAMRDYAAGVAGEMQQQFKLFRA